MSHLVLIFEKHLPGLLEKQLKSQVNQSNFKNLMSHLVLIIEKTFAWITGKTAQKSGKPV